MPEAVFDLELEAFDLALETQEFPGTFLIPEEAREAAREGARMVASEAGARIVPVDADLTEPRPEPPNCEADLAVGARIVPEEALEATPLCPPTRCVNTLWSDLLPTMCKAHR